ncbi:MAG TPA: phosphoribosylamine--glycine ligase [Gemmatimonadaceae bacterium]|nr:phosphoribosylamine--glycine ligase [Gemmatimonadaceae bacterium]
MRILVVGGGAREHALGWKLLRDDPRLELIAAPGNPGLAALGRCVDISSTDIAGLALLARKEDVALTVVGPEAALDAGIVDHFRQVGLAVFGPSKRAAQIESSKRFAKELMRAAGVPTARATTFTDVASARAEARRLGVPVVIKASGLAAGKGVIVAETIGEADEAISSMLDGHAFGEAGREVLVEEYLRGEEISVLALTDGVVVLPMLASQDHKRIGEGDTGPNTGGMGAYAPVSIATSSVVEWASERIFQPTLRALAAAGAPFTGLLYAGLMLTADGPKVIEFNCRFGDPETEAILPLMESSLLEPMRAIANGDAIAGAAPLSWRSGAAVATVIAAGGYPGAVSSGDAITLPPDEPDVIVFHAGTTLDGSGTLVTAGGRVLAVTALGPTLADAQRRSAAHAGRVQFAGRHFRRDIGWRELARVRPHAGAS